DIEIVLGLLVAVAALAALAHRLDVPYPILLVLGGAALALVPGLPHVELRPELVFLLFLPPLLYHQAFMASWRDLRANAGTFSLRDAALGFVVSAVGGVVIGLVVGWAAAWLRRRIDDAPVEITISLLTGFAAYLPAEALGVSGVLAVVTCGIVVSRLAPRL